MTNPEISVIICTHNRAQRLRALIHDFESQAFPDGKFPWELVIVDNNSTDGTREYIDGFKKNSKLQVNYVFEPRQGKTFALNTGIRAATSESLCFTDDDVKLDRHWLSSAYRAFKEHTYNCFGGKVLPIIEGTLPDWLTEHGKYSFYGGPLVRHDKGDRNKEYDEGMWVPAGCNMFIRKSVFEIHGNFSTELGFMDKNVLICGEDSELMFRFKKNGENILYYPAAVVYHPAPAHRMKKSYFKKWCWGTGRGRARWLNVPPGTVRYFNIPRYMIREFIADLIKWLIVLPSPKSYKRFFYEMQLVYKSGMFFEYYIEGD